MAERRTTKKATAKKPKKDNVETQTTEEASDEATLGALDALGKAIEEARSAGLVVKAWATCNTTERGTTVRY